MSINIKDFEIIHYPDFNHKMNSVLFNNFGLNCGSFEELLSKYKGMISGGLPLTVFNASDKQELNNYSGDIDIWIPLFTANNLEEYKNSAIELEKQFEIEDEFRELFKDSNYTQVTYGKNELYEIGRSLVMYKNHSTTIKKLQAVMSRNNFEFRHEITRAIEEISRISLLQRKSDRERIDYNNDKLTILFSKEDNMVQDILEKRAKHNENYSKLELIIVAKLKLLIAYLADNNSEYYNIPNRSRSTMKTFDKFANIIKVDNIPPIEIYHQVIDESIINKSVLDIDATSFCGILRTLYSTRQYHENILFYDLVDVIYDIILKYVRNQNELDKMKKDELKLTDLQNRLVELSSKKIIKDSNVLTSLKADLLNMISVIDSINSVNSINSLKIIKEDESEKSEESYVLCDEEKEEKKDNINDRVSRIKHELKQAKKNYKNNNITSSEYDEICDSLNNELNIIFKLQEKMTIIKNDMEYTDRLGFDKIFTISRFTMINEDGDTKEIQLIFTFISHHKMMQLFDLSFCATGWDGSNIHCLEPELTSRKIGYRMNYRSMEREKERSRKYENRGYKIYVKKEDISA